MRRLARRTSVSFSRHVIVTNKTNHPRSRVRISSGSHLEIPNVEKQTHMDGRPLMTFVRADNAPSLRAHHKMGMRDLGAFSNEGVAYIALAFDQPSKVDIHSK
jgi:hypothetical protein